MNITNSFINQVLYHQLPQLVSPENHYLSSLEGLTGVLISGVNAAKFLQGQFTCDITELKPNEVKIGAYCDYKGRVIANFWIWPQDNDFAILLPRSILTAFCDQLNKYALLSKVTITPDLNYGAALYLAAKNRAPIKITEEAIHHGALSTQNLPDHTLTWLIGPKEALAKLKLTLACQTHLIDSTAGGLLQILTGFSFIHPETSLLFTPQMLNLHLLGAVSFRKGCYVGQEVISRTQHLGKLKRHLYAGIIKNASTVSLGGELKNPKGDVVGIIFSAIKIEENDYILVVLQDQAFDQAVLFNQSYVEIYNV